MLYLHTNTAYFRTTCFVRTSHKHVRVRTCLVSKTPFLVTFFTKTGPDPVYLPQGFWAPQKHCFSLFSHVRTSTHMSKNTVFGHFFHKKQARIQSICLKVFGHPKNTCFSLFWHVRTSTHMSEMCKNTRFWTLRHQTPSGLRSQPRCGPKGFETPENHCFCMFSQCPHVQNSEKHLFLTVFAVLGPGPSSRAASRRGQKTGQNSGFWPKTAVFDPF